MKSDAIERNYERLITAMNSVGSAGVLFLMIIIVGDIGGRAIFNHPLTGTPEIAKISIVAILFLGITKTLKMGKHIRGTFLVERVSPKFAAALNILANLSGFLLFALLCYSSWRLTWVAWKVGEYGGEGALRVPTYPLRTLILFSSFLMCIQFFINIFQVFEELQNLRRKAC